MAYSQKVEVDGVTYTAHFEVSSWPRYSGSYYEPDNPGELDLLDVIIEHKDGSYTSVYEDLSEELINEIWDALEFPEDN